MIRMLARLFLRFRYWRCAKYKGHVYYVRRVEEGGSLKIITYECLHCGDYYFKYPKKENET